jgi:cellulose synthase/poly-beta-1,6-N-acetylglucosamine synthase-like glycosyltransferase
MAIFYDIIFWTDHLILFYFIGLNSIYLLLLVLSIPEILLRFKEINSEDIVDLLKSESIPPISVIAPCYNEELSILESVYSMLHLSYPNIEVIVVNDGSTDKSLQNLIFRYKLRKIPPATSSFLNTAKVLNYYRSDFYPNLIVVDKVNGGKADALNAGINVCSSPFFMAVDSDTIIERDALRRMIRPVLTEPNTIASGGTIRIVNNCKVESGRVVEVNYPKNMLAMIQVVEYLRAFLFGRLGWNHLGGNLVISGAFGLFNKEAVINVGGYLTDTVGEDMELTVRLHRYYREKKIPYHIAFIPDPVAWTEVPETLSVLGHQRERWHRGLIDTLHRHRKMLLNTKYGIVGFLSFPFMYFGEMLSPLVEIFGYIGMGVGIYFGTIEWKFAMMFFLVAWGLSLILTIYTILLEEFTFRRYSKLTDFFRMIFAAIMENFGYRQIMVFYRLSGFISIIRKNKKWGKMKRKGFLGEEEEIK